MAHVRSSVATVKNFAAIVPDSSAIAAAADLLRRPHALRSRSTALSACAPPPLESCVIARP